MTQRAAIMLSGLIIFRRAFIRYVEETAPTEAFLWEVPEGLHMASGHALRRLPHRTWKCVRSHVWYGDQWQWLCEPTGANRDVRSWVRSGYHSPLNDQVTVKEGCGLFCAKPTCPWLLYSDHSPWDLEGKSKWNGSSACEKRQKAPQIKPITSISIKFTPVCLTGVPTMLCALWNAGITWNN